MDTKALQNLVGVRRGERGGGGANELFVQMANTRLFLHLYKAFVRDLTLSDPLFTSEKE